MSWTTFWSSVIGSVPGLIVSLILLWVNHQSSRRAEADKAKMAAELAELQQKLAEQNSRSEIWHGKRVAAFIEIYESFGRYIDYIRRRFLLAGTRMSADPRHEHDACVERNSLYLDDDLRRFVEDLNGELLGFENWAVRKEKERLSGFDDGEVQEKLDFEIPTVLDRIRQRFNLVADPRYVVQRPQANDRRKMRPQRPLPWPILRYFISQTRVKSPIGAPNNDFSGDHPAAIMGDLFCRRQQVKISDACVGRVQTHYEQKFGRGPDDGEGTL